MTNKYDERKHPRNADGTYAQKDTRHNDHDLNEHHDQSFLNAGTPTPRMERLDGRSAARITETLKRDDAMGPEFDELRTKLAAYQGARRGWRKRNDRSFPAIHADVRRPDGGMTWDPVSNTVPVSGFCFSQYPKRCLKLPKAPDDPKEFRRMLDE